MREADQAPCARKVAAANPVPCSACPWRTENHGKPHPNGWYTAKNRERLWSKLRRGDSMSCHPTDPSNPIPDGAKPVPEDATTHECAGGLILQQRELEKAQGFKLLKEYTKSTRLGLTMQGLALLVNRAFFGGTPLGGGLKMTSVNLNEPVSHPPLGAWEPEKVRAARKAREQQPKGSRE